MAIPAQNEAATIATCLKSIDRAAGQCDYRVIVVVAADTCHDDTARIARTITTAHCKVTVVEGTWRGAGRARAAAVEAALRIAQREPHTVWIANTDADCRVPADWLRRQLAYATTGACAVAGTVALDPGSTSTRLLADFAATYHIGGRSHRYVHAANLGIRADTYLRIGGWGTHTVVGEDHELWRRLRANHATTMQPTDVSVITSSRTTSRVPGGFATALSRLRRTHAAPAAAAS